MQIDRDIEFLKEVEKQGRNDFLQLALQIDQSFLNNMEDRWNGLPYEDPTRLKLIHLEKFLIPTTLRAAILSVIVVYEDSQLYSISYAHSDYENHEELLLNMSFTGEQLIVIGDEDVDFGEGNRIFLSGRKLKTSDEVEVYLYTGFHEQVRIQDFISTTHTETLDNIQKYSSSMLAGVIQFMGFAIIYGILLIVLIRWFIVKSLKWMAMIKPFGQIALEKKYMTDSQIEQCLRLQQNDFKKKEWDYVSNKKR